MENREKKELNFWPYAIVGMILTVVMLAIWTIKIAIKNPVQLENSYMMKYQDVDENINEILMKQRQFKSGYDVKLDKNRLKLGSNRVEVVVSDKEGNPVDNAKIVALITRPDTAEFDIELKNFSNLGGEYRSEEFNLSKSGRWNIVVRVNVGELEGFETYKTFVK
ncbi:FixH family protein [Hydrogenimonas sp.]